MYPVRLNGAGLDVCSGATESALTIQASRALPDDKPRQEDMLVRGRIGILNELTQELEGQSTL
jgi:hypothetical protein